MNDRCSVHTRTVRLAQTSVLLTAVAIAILAAHGASDWSQVLAVTWWGLLAVAVTCSIAAVAMALFGDMPGRRRLNIALLSAPAPLTAAGMVLFVIAWFAQNTS